MLDFEQKIIHTLSDPNHEVRVYALYILKQMPLSPLIRKTLTNIVISEPNIRLQFLAISALRLQLTDIDPTVLLPILTRYFFDSSLNTYEKLIGAKTISDIVNYDPRMMKKLDDANRATKDVDVKLQWIEIRKELDNTLSGPFTELRIIHGLYGHDTNNRKKSLTVLKNIKRQDLIFKEIIKEQLLILFNTQDFKLLDRVLIAQILKHHMKMAPWKIFKDTMQVNHVLKQKNDSIINFTKLTNELFIE